MPTLPDAKKLTFFMLFAFVVGHMIGTGIYVLPASLAPFGTLAILAWIYTSIGSMFLALTFANLNRRFPKTGGPYAFCNLAFGPAVGFIVAYIYWFSSMASIAGIAVASMSYVGYIFPALNSANPAFSPTLLLICELFILWFFTIINLITIRTVGFVQILLTIIKVLPLIIIILVGIFYIKETNLTNVKTTHLSFISSLGQAAALTFWAFIGLESATVPAENADSDKSVYQATLIGTAFAALIYIFSTIVLLGMVPTSELENSQFPFAIAATVIFGQHAAIIVAICAILSGLGALNACILVQGQIVFAAARDGFFPKIFARRSKSDIPVAGQILSSSIISIFLFMTIEATLLEQFKTIILFAALLSLVTYFFATLAELKLIKQDVAKNKRQYGKVAVALLAALYSGWMIASFDFKMLAICFIMLLAFLPLYFFIIRKKHRN